MVVLVEIFEKFMTINIMFLLQVNEDYTGTFVFDNDFPALLKEGPYTGTPTLIFSRS